MCHVHRRRAFLAGIGAAALAAGCRSRAGRGPLVLRLSHSMAAGTTALHVFGDTFRQLAEEATGGAVTVRVFPSGTLGQEREVVQQLQEGLVDFMVSGTAIWGSVAPKLQVFDFPFLWRDWDHVHRVVDGPVGREAADYLERPVRMRPLAWGDSFGFRQVITRSRDVTEHEPARRAQDSDDPVADLRQGRRADGREPDADGLRRGLHVAPDRRDRRLRARREHDAAAALLRGRGLHGAHAPHRGRARPVGVDGHARRGFRPSIRAALEGAALEAARRQRAMGPARGYDGARRSWRRTA